MVWHGNYVMVVWYWWYCLKIGCVTRKSIQIRNLRIWDCFVVLGCQKACLSEIVLGVPLGTWSVEAMLLVAIVLEVINYCFTRRDLVNFKSEFLIDFQKTSLKVIPNTQHSRALVNFLPLTEPPACMYKPYDGVIAAYSVDSPSAVYN